MILRNHIPKGEYQEALEYYTTHHDHVSIVKCGQCGTPLALEVSGGGDGLAKQDQRGVAVLPLGGDLLASRVRLDETPDGKPMMGYQCICGNDTRLSEAEQHHPPRNGWFVDLMPHEHQQVRTAIKLCGQHVSDYSESEGVRKYESFEVEVLK